MSSAETAENGSEAQRQSSWQVHFAVAPRHAVVCLAAVAFFLYLNDVPLFHSDVWGHVLYGQWIIDHCRLPTEDPFLPLATGVPVVDTAWLSQVILGMAERWGGAEALSLLFASSYLGVYAVLGLVYRHQSGQASLAAMGLMMAFFFNWTRHQIIRPEMFGVLALAILLWLIVTGDPKRWCFTANDASQQVEGRGPVRRLWLGIPLLFALWANLHGSFAVGLVLLGCQTLGLIFEAAWQSRNLERILSDRGVRLWLILSLLALAATLANPYGIGLWWETATFARNPNLREILEWYPLKLIDLEGRQLACSLVLLVVLWRHSRWPIHPAAVLMLAVLIAAVADSIRMMSWYAPVVTLVLMPHAADVWRRLVSSPGLLGRFRSLRPMAWAGRLQGAKSWACPYHLVCLLILLVGGALTPLGKQLLGGTLRKPSSLYSEETPLRLTGYLQENPPRGLMFVPQWWGEWITFAGPPGTRVFMTSNVHLAPPQVWRDYMRVQNAETGWEETLDRYDVQALITDKDSLPALTRLARRSAAWKAVYEDDQCLVLTRHEGD